MRLSDPACGSLGRARNTPPLRDTWKGRARGRRGRPFPAIVLLLCLFWSHAATANVLRVFQPGDRLPEFTLPDLASGKPVTVRPGAKKPAALFFFSITPEFRKKRSLALLRELSGFAGEFRNRVEITGIYVEEEGGANRNVVLDFASNLPVPVPILNDRDRSVYDAYGVFMMPLVVLVNDRGELHEVVPYTYEIKKIIQGNFHYLLGDWTVQQLRAFLKPKENVELSAEEKEYIRRVNYGRVLARRKMYTQAMREFRTAIKIFPKKETALNELGFAQIARRKWDEAEKTFRRVLSLDSQSDDGIAGLGLALYGRGDVEAALPQLENALIAPEPRLEVILALAEIHEKRGNMRKAIRLNKLAIARLMQLFNQRWQ